MLTLTLTLTLALTLALTLTLPTQAIYGWRGAEARNQAKFDSDFGIVDGPDTRAAPMPAEAFASISQLRRAVALFDYHSSLEHYLRLLCNN